MLTSRLFRWFLLVLCIALGSIYTYNRIFSLTGRITAQSAGTRIGTHLGEGSIEFQNSILDAILPKILAENGSDPTDFPVTISVQIDTSDSEVSKLGATVKKHGYFPMIRVYGACRNVNPVPLIQSLRTHFGADVIISFGNELNLYALECENKNWGQFRTNYLLIEQALGPENMRNITPGPIAWYLDKDQDDPSLPREEQAVTGDTLLSVGGLSDIYSRPGRVRTANGYGCAFVDEADCNPTETTDQLLSLKGIDGRPTYMTEFGLAPRRKDDKAPDSNLEKVIAFIKNEEEKNLTGAIKIAPLIRNICKGPGNTADWLLYVKGRIYTNLGKPIDPKTCKEDGNFLDDLLGLFRRKPEEFTITPIEGFNGEDFLAAVKEGNTLKIADTLAGAGYGVSCGAQAFGLQAEYANEENLKRFLELNPQGAVLLPRTTQLVDTSRGKAPILRTDTFPQSRSDSYEGYLGVPPDWQEPDFTHISYSPLANLMPFAQRCHYADWIQQQAEEICDANANPELCAMTRDPIPNTQYTFKTLRDARLQSGLSCDMLGLTPDLLQKRYPDVAAQTDTAIFRDLQLAYNNAPLFSPSNYRLVFVLFATEVPQDKDANCDHTFFRNLGITPKKDPYYNCDGTSRHNVTVITALWPAVDDDQNLQSYRAPSLGELLRSFFTPAEDLEALEIEDQVRRQEMAARIDANKDKSLSDPSLKVRPIYPQYPPDPLTHAVVSVVNGGEEEGESLDCSLPVLTEQSELIYSETVFEEDERFTLKDGANWFASLFSSASEQEKSPQEATLETGSEVIVTADDTLTRGRGNTSKAYSYVISPFDFKNDKVVAEMSSYLYTQADLAQFEELKRLQELAAENGESGGIEGEFTYPADYLSFMDIFQDLERTPASISFADPVGGCTSVDEDGKPLPGCLKTVSVEVGGPESGIAVPAPQQGSLTRLVQQVTNPEGDAGYERARNSVDTSEYFTGQAGGDGGTTKEITDSVGQGITPPGNFVPGLNSCQAYAEQTTIIPDELTVKRMVRGAAQKYSINATMLWGVLQIEGSPFLRAMRNGDTSISCGELINSCGAVGPMQIIQGVCTTNCGGLTEYLKTFKRDGDLCQIDGALEWAAKYLATSRKSLLVSLLPEPLKDYAAAGMYHGLDVSSYGPFCTGAPPVDGCNGMNYCQCAVDGFVL